MHRLRASQDEFIEKWKHEDVDYEFEWQEDIPHTKKFTLVYNDKKGSKPWYANLFAVIFLDIVMFGWFQRYYLEKNTFEVKYKLVKYIIN